ncbi:type III PLP-dependent enzyme domain-containing protein [Sphingobacterium faecale]|uniref:Arginine decarboxylase n=1 Tax=Sphingobacterium faecale TaxID=2803775 RepID=A0ABS1QYE4_9SPHI|nr:arginine decarboxylase [Sphingobacterium faecale]MBL1407438.1 arginine decarboxylase [Sphingobacterium faecale]
MKTKYIDLIDQTFVFPQPEFTLDSSNQLLFHGVDLMQLVAAHGTPLKFTYLPRISQNIQRSKSWFQKAMKKISYQGEYHYCYCTKSSHFSFVLEEVLKNNVHIETSSAFDINIVEKLISENKISNSTSILCNGFKNAQYLDNIIRLNKARENNVIVILDNYEELNLLLAKGDKKINVGIRIASEESPKFEFYTSRLGIGYKNILTYYRNEIKNNDSVELKMLHFFINSGIRDTSYYWNELLKCIKIYVELKKECPSLDSLDIGGGFPIKNSLAFEYDYEYMVEEILSQIKNACSEAHIPEPKIFTEFGSFTVGESAGAIYKVAYQKKQNDRERWNMIDSSFITTLPDSWAINSRFILLALNRWNENYERVLLGGVTCDSEDYYNSEQHLNAIYLPKFNKDKPLYIGFFNTGAYQESIGGFGGIHHCLIPHPKHILIDRDQRGEIKVDVFSEQQNEDQVLDILGYNRKDK